MGPSSCWHHVGKLEEADFVTPFPHSDPGLSVVFRYPHTSEERQIEQSFDPIHGD